MIVRGYHAEVERLSDRLGGGFVAYAPALKGCLADGKIEDEALQNLQDAIHCWLEAARSKGRPIAAPMIDSRYRTAAGKELNDEVAANCAVGTAEAELERT